MNEKEGQVPQATSPNVSDTPAPQDTASTAIEQIIAERREKLSARQAEKPFLFLRNILNGVFILLAILAMIGIAVFKNGTTEMTISYYIGIVAVLVKFAEVVLRMPAFRNNSFLKAPRKSSQHK